MTKSVLYPDALQLIVWEPVQWLLSVQILHIEPFDGIVILMNDVFVFLPRMRKLYPVHAVYMTLT